MMDGMDRETGEIVAMEPIGIPPALAAAIIAVKKQVKQLGTDERNTQGGYNALSVDKMYAIVGQLMADAGIGILIDETASDIKASEKTGNPWLFTSYVCRIIHESGAMSPPMRRSLAMPISGPQAFGAAQSYIEKQFMRQVFKVPIGERDADAIAPSEDAPAGRRAGRTAQGDAPRSTAAPQGTTSHPTRPQAAPESDAKTAANARWKEMRAEIDASMTLADVRMIDGSPAWKTMEKMIGDIESPETTESALAMLRDRIEKRVAMLEEQGVAPEGTDQYGRVY